MTTDPHQAETQRQSGVPGVRSGVAFQYGTVNEFIAIAVTWVPGEYGTVNEFTAIAVTWVPGVTTCIPGTVRPKFR